MLSGRRRHYGRGSGAGGGMGTIFMGLQAFSFFNFLSRSDRFFPVTLGVLALNIVTHLRPSGLNVVWPSLKQACISVQSVCYSRDWKRIFMSPFFHSGNNHLYYNMASFVWKAVTLERYFGSFYFMYMVAVFSVATGLLYLVLSYVLAEVLDQLSMVQSCAVGFSGVIFALKVVTTHIQPNSMTMVMGMFPVPTRLACWAELVLISVIFPNVSFVGHLSGILVGLAFVWGPLKNVMDTPLYMVDFVTGVRNTERRSEDEELEEAIRRSIQHHEQQRENADRRTSANRSTSTSGLFSERELQLAYERSLRENHTPQPPETPPPPFNPSYSPPPSTPTRGRSDVGLGVPQRSAERGASLPTSDRGLGGSAERYRNAERGTSLPGERYRYAERGTSLPTAEGERASLRYRHHSQRGQDMDTVRAARLRRFGGEKN